MKPRSPTNDRPSAPLSVRIALPGRVPKALSSSSPSSSCACALSAWPGMSKSPVSLGRRCFRHAAVHHVHRAADGAAAVEQGGGALQDLDLLGEERFDAHCVVHAHRRHVATAEAVAEDLHPGTVHAADDRSADARAERRRLHAGQAIDGFAEAAGPGVVQRLAGQHLDRLRQVFRGRGQWRRADHDAVQVHRGVVAFVLGGRERRGHREEGGDRQRELRGTGRGALR